MMNTLKLKNIHKIFKNVLDTCIVFIMIRYNSICRRNIYFECILIIKFDHLFNVQAFNSFKIH